MAEKRGVDLLIVGTDVHAGTGRLYLGPQIERLLNGSPFPIIVFNT